MAIKFFLLFIVLVHKQASSVFPLGKINKSELYVLSLYIARYVMYDKTWNIKVHVMTITMLKLREKCFSNHNNYKYYG